MSKKHMVWWILALGLAACSLPFSYDVDALRYAGLSGTFISGTFEVGEGGISPNPKTVGPVGVNYTPDPRVSLSGTALDYEVCFASETPGATFSGTLAYTAYLGGDQASLFSEANKLGEGSRDISGLSGGEVCVSGRGSATPDQVRAIASGTFYVGARISGDAVSSQRATIRYQTKRFTLRLSGSVRP